MTRIILALVLGLMATAASAQDIYRPISYYTVDTSSTPNNHTSQVSSRAKYARVVCTVSCYVAFPVSPIVAESTSPIFLPANTVEYIKISGSTVAYVISESSGTLYVNEVE